LFNSISHLFVRRAAVVKWCTHVRLLKCLVAPRLGVNLRIAMP